MRESCVMRGADADVVGGPFLKTLFRSLIAGNRAEGSDG